MKFSLLLVIFFLVSCGEIQPTTEPSKKATGSQSSTPTTVPESAPIIPPLPIEITPNSKAKLPEQVYKLIADFPNVTPAQKNGLLTKVHAALEAKPKLPHLRQQMIEEAVAHVGNFPGWAPSIVQAANAALPLPADLTYMVKEIATFLLQEAKDRNVPLDKGRKSLDEEMEKSSRQLDADLPRAIGHASASYMNLGNRRLTGLPAPTESSAKQFFFLAKNLEKYVKAQNKNISVGNGKIGKFWVAELVYPIVQSFVFRAYTLAVTDHPEYFSPPWSAPAGKDSQIYGFSLNADGHTFTVSAQIVKQLLNTDKPTETKGLTTISRASFDLESGKVTYSHEYKLDGKVKRPPFVTDIF